MAPSALLPQVRQSGRECLPDVDLLASPPARAATEADAEAADDGQEDAEHDKIVDERDEQHHEEAAKLLAGKQTAHLLHLLELVECQVVVERFDAQQTAIFGTFAGHCSVPDGISVDSLIDFRLGLRFPFVREYV